MRLQHLRSASRQFLSQRDTDNPAGATHGSIVQGIVDDGWLEVLVPGVGTRFLPMSIDGEIKLCPLELAEAKQ